MGALTDSTTFPPAVRQYYNRKLLMRALPKLVYMRVAERYPLARRSGDIMVFRRYEALNTATAPLIEGNPPSGQKLTKTDINVRIQQFGDYIALTDIVQAVMDSPILNETNKLLGEQAAQTMDELLRDVAAAGTSVQYGGSATSRAELTTTTHKISTAALDRVMRQLENANADRFTSIIKAGVNVDTHPIRPAYWGIIHPDVLFTLQTLTGYVPFENYASQGPVMEAEVGAYKNIRFLDSTKAKKFLGGGGTASGDVKSTGGLADVYATMIFAENAIAVVPLEGMSLENIIKPIGSAGSADPLNQIATSGWKHTGARIRLNENFMVRLETTAGDVAP